MGLAIGTSRKGETMPTNTTPQPGLQAPTNHFEHIHDMIAEQWREDRVIHHFEKKELRNVNHARNY